MKPIAAGRANRLDPAARLNQLPFEAPLGGILGMQEGIGRSGYRVIALVFFGLGLLGLLTTYATFGADGLYEWLGYALLAVSLVTLLILGLQVLSVRPAGSTGSSQAPTIEPVPGLLPAPMASDPNADLGVDYSGGAEPQPVAEDEMRPVSYAPPEQPRAPIFVHPRRVDQVDTKGWPKRREPTGMTRGELMKSKREQPEFEAGREAPLVMARTAASAEASGIPDNVSLGKCGNCSVLLLAPKRRPIRLQCPRCERVHTMT